MEFWDDYLDKLEMQSDGLFWQGIAHSMKTVHTQYNYSYRAYVRIPLNEFLRLTGSGIANFEEVYLKGNVFKICGYTTFNFNRENLEQNDALFSMELDLKLIDNQLMSEIRTSLKDIINDL